MALSKREVSAVLPATLELAHRCSTLALLLSSPYVQSRREYRAKTIRRPPNDLEDSENHRSAGGHGNQHVRLRSAQIEKRRSDLPGSGICEPGAAADVANIASRQNLAIGFFLRLHTGPKLGAFGPAIFLARGVSIRTWGRALLAAGFRL